MEEVLLSDEMIMKFIFLSLELAGEWFSATQHLQGGEDDVVPCDQPHLEHVLPEHLLIILPELVQDSLAEVREVDETILDNVVGQVYHLLLHGVQAKHLHGCMQVLTRQGSESINDIQL